MGFSFWERRKLMAFKISSVGADFLGASERERAGEAESPHAGAKGRKEGALRHSRALSP